MLSFRFLNNLRTIRNAAPTFKVLHNKFKSNDNKEQNSNVTVQNQDDKSLGSMATKYKIFKDQDSEVIWDIYEQRLQHQEELNEQEEQEKDEFEGINLERGYSGVYDIEDLVDVLRKEKGQHIFVASVPKEIKYVDYIVLVNGKSARHMQALAEFVRRVYKKKMNKGDHYPKIEGLDSQDWIAIDLGNIALHIFSDSARQLYDLDTLWAVGPEFDREYNKQDPVAEMLEKHAMLLKDFQPAS